MAAKSANGTKNMAISIASPSNTIDNTAIAFSRF
jgi:hypothetical protein